MELKEYKFIKTTTATITTSRTTLTTPNTQRDTKSLATHYTVQKGDTLWLIAKKVTGDGANYKAIAQKNNITNPDKIYVGQKLVI